MYYKYFYILLLVTCFISCSGKEKLENKNDKNNSFENAQVINKDGINGSIATSEKDYYSFNIDKIQYIDLYISNTFPLYITLYNDKREIIKVINETNTSEQVIKNILLEQTNYYIQVENNNSINSEYSLILSKKEYKDNREKEPNDNINLSQVIDLNSENRLITIEGYYNQTFNPLIQTGDFKDLEIDSYIITNSSFNTFSVSFELSGVPSIDFKIRLYDSKGNFILEKDINKTGDGETIDKLVLYPYMSYYSVIYGDNAVYNIPYRFSIIAKPYDKYIEEEPNNKENEAKNIEFAKTYKGAIDYSYDKDYYYFNIPIKSDIKLSYFLIDSEAINISISNNNFNISKLPQIKNEYIVSLEQGKYYIIFESDLKKEKWEKGYSKPRNYEFNISVSNRISSNYGFIDEYTNDILQEENSNDTKQENNLIIIKEEDLNSDIFYYTNTITNFN